MADLHALYPVRGPDLTGESAFRMRRQEVAVG